VVDGRRDSQKGLGGGRDARGDLADRGQGSGDVDWAEAIERGEVLGVEGGQWQFVGQAAGPSKPVDDG
jgi:hypothetical protein